jgi:excisionase family DNA binding protein
VDSAGIGRAEIHKLRVVRGADPTEVSEGGDGLRLAYSVEEAARILGLGRTMTWGLVRSGELPSVRVAGRVLIRRRQLEDWLSSMPETVYPSAW